MRSFDQQRGTSRGSTTVDALRWRPTDVDESNPAVYIDTWTRSTTRSSRAIAPSSSRKPSAASSAAPRGSRSHLAPAVTRRHRSAASNSTRVTSAPRSRSRTGGEGPDRGYSLASPEGPDREGPDRGRTRPGILFGVSVGHTDHEELGSATRHSAWLDCRRCRPTDVDEPNLAVYIDAWTRPTVRDAHLAPPGGHTPSSFSGFELDLRYVCATITFANRRSQ